MSVPDRTVPDLVVRAEQPGDADAIREVHRQAFETGVEAEIVDRLRETCTERISLVAQLGGEVVGHILFTPAVARAGGREVAGMGLAPVAVRPVHQRKGIGAALVRRGLARVREAGYPFVVVLGHPAYYPRFGFERASTYGLACAYDGVPDEAFMILVFDPEAVRAASGVVRYRPEFDAAV